MKDCYFREIGQVREYAVQPGIGTGILHEWYWGSTSTGALHEQYRHSTVCSDHDIGSKPFRICTMNTICYNSNCPNLWSIAAVSCTICANLYLFPVTLCTYVQETAASKPQFAKLLNKILTC